MLQHFAYFFIYFLLFSFQLCASDQETTPTIKVEIQHGTYIKPKQSNRLSSMISNKTQAYIFYGLSFIFGLATTGMGYSTLFDITKNSKEVGYTSRIMTESLATCLYAGATLFTGYQGYKKGKKQKEYQLM